MVTIIIVLDTLGRAGGTVMLCAHSSLALVYLSAFVIDARLIRAERAGSSVRATID
jgi:hypothetical protein